MTSKAMQSSGRKKLGERDWRVLKQIVTSKKRTTAEKIIAKLNQHLDSPVPMIKARKHLQKHNIYDKAAIPKPLITDINAKRRLQWCHTHKI
ncbi:uncharacterized protein TNCV_4393401 [Trichonephila clavipes]|nr:uncharacterized protein TNCV_4393401 [Trichonephila clavipes]